MINGWYLIYEQHAIDIEATIRNGALDVGIFGLTEMISLEEGERLLENIKEELQGLRDI